MFRRIGKFIEDIAETVRRERGKLQILSDETKFPFRIGTFHERQPNLQIKNSSSLKDLFLSKDLKTESEKIKIKGFVDTATLLNVVVKPIVFDATVKTLEKPRERDLLIKTISLQQLKKIQIKKNEKIEILGVAIKNKEFDVHEGQIRDSNITVHLGVSDLKTDFTRFQAKYFHLENSSAVNVAIEDCSLLFRPVINDTLACIFRFPVRRTRVPKSGYDREDLKNALSFIIERYPSEGKLKMVGIYKNVPIDSAEKLTFSQDRQLSFYLKRANNKRPLLMDVLVVNTNKGKYHVGPIIRAT